MTMSAQKMTPDRQPFGHRARSRQSDGLRVRTPCRFDFDDLDDGTRMSSVVTLASCCDNSGTLEFVELERVLDSP